MRLLGIWEADNDGRICGTIIDVIQKWTNKLGKKLGKKLGSEWAKNWAKIGQKLGEKVKENTALLLVLELLVDYKCGYQKRANTGCGHYSKIMV